MYNCVLSASVTFDEVASVINSNGRPGRSGYAGDGYCYCNDCVPTDFKSTDKAILRTDEWDYPGPSCDICNKKLPVKLIHYPSCDCGCIPDGDLL